MYSKIHSTYKEAENITCLQRISFNKIVKENCIPVWRWIPKVHAKFGELLEIRAEFEELFGIIPMCVKITTKINLNTFAFNTAQTKVSIRALIS